MSNERPLKPDEIREWVEETRRDTLLTTPPELPKAEPPAPETTVRLRSEEAPPLPRQAKISAPRPLTIGETHAMDKRLARRFTRGELPLDATLDLHGMPADTAHDAVNAFIISQHARGARHVCIITGKGRRGGGVLRDAIGVWLNMPRLRTRIIAAVHGRPHKGGEGAVYVLLKRHGRACSHD